MIEYKSQNCKLFQNLKKSEEKHRILYANAKKLLKNIEK